MLLLALAGGQAHAAVSYLLIQGAFGGGPVTTYKWEVIYSAGQIVTGEDLFNAVFGTPVRNGSYTDGFSGTYNYYTQGNSTQGAAYFSFNGGTNPSGNLLESITLGGNKLAMDPSYDPGWNYYNAGGNDGDPTSPLVYDGGLWTFGNSGFGQRVLTDGSFDAFVYGETFPNAPVAGSDSNTGTAMANDPVASSFSGATVINLTTAPEPGRLGLLSVGVMALLLRRRRI
jgi:hypothetical protein